MTSLRLRLFAILVIATGLLWLCAAGWISISTRREIESVLDIRLQEAAHTVDSLVSTGGAILAREPAIDQPTTNLPMAYQHQVSCQIWSVDGRLVAKSDGTPGTRLTNSPAGFSERMVDGEPWRIYAIDDPAKGVQILVGDRIGKRESVVRNLMEGLLGPGLLILPLLAGAIWAALTTGLRPLKRLAGELAGRGADDMSPLAIDRVPRDVGFFIAALNALFGKVEAARKHERDVTAFAAHELRTPLAGLKTQAQIALAAADGPTRDKALRQILAAVDRSSRLIRQLLDISRLDARADATREESVELGSLAREVVDAIPPPSGAMVHTILSPDLDGLRCRAERETLVMALRNLQENAVQHMPGGGTISWCLANRTPDRVWLAIEDEGRGIPEDELPSVRQRFFRGRAKTALGSGLGLAIVEQSLRRSSADFTLANRTDRSGLRVEIALCATTKASSS